MFCSVVLQLRKSVGLSNVLVTCGHSKKCKFNYVLIVLNCLTLLVLCSLLYSVLTKSFQCYGITHNAFEYGDSKHFCWT